ncbi:MAG: hypothetical protein ACSHYA_18970 [Opitutaceae bacterium]
MNQALPKSYAYKPKVLTMLMCIFFFGLCAIVIALKAKENEQGLVLNGIFTFSERGADIFYWSLVVGSVGFVLIGLIALLKSITGSLNLELTETEIRIPKGFIKKAHVNLQLAELVNISESEVNGQRFLYLHTKHGNLSVSRSMMANKESYEEFRELISSIVEVLNEPSIEPTDCGNG